MFSPFNITPRYWVGKSLLFFLIVPERRRQVGVIHVDCPGHGTLSRLTTQSDAQNGENRRPLQGQHPQVQWQETPWERGLGPTLQQSWADWVSQALPEGLAMARDSSQHQTSGGRTEPVADLTQAEASRASPSDPVEAVPLDSLLWPHCQLCWTEPQRRSVPSEGSSHSPSTDRNDSS